MEDFVARPDLVSRERLRALSRKSDGPGLRRLAAHLGALAVTGTGVWAASATLWVVPAMVVHGIVLVFLFCPLHEAVHGTAFRTRWLNERTADLCGFLTVYPRIFYRCFHFAHHRYTQDPRRDPELAVPKPRTRREYLVWISGWYYWTGKFRGLFRYAFSGRARDAHVPERMEKPLVMESRLVLGGYGAAVLFGIVVDPLLPLMYWAVPALLGQPFLRMYLIAEHTGCAQTGDMLQNVRTTLAGPLVRWLAWNMPFHTEHHTFPSVPFHQLPAMHQEIKAHLVHTAPSHPAFNQWVWRDLAPGRAVTAR
ncbi:MAG: fatty acid desaturase [Rhodospirillales bacterium]